MKVFCIGWAKTGTTTFGRCMTTLGYRHQSRAFDLLPDLERGDLTRLHEVVDAHDSFDDWPWIVVFRELDQAHPSSRFVLTVREPDSWLRSYRNMLRQPGESTPEKHRRRRQLYGLPFPDVTDDQLLARYRQHEADVREWFRDRPDDLLVVDWAAGDGWAELCGFLGVPEPKAPFPRANPGRYRGVPLPAFARRALNRIR